MDIQKQKRLDDVTDLLSQISDMNDMIATHNENKFMQDEFSNRKSGLVEELKKILKEFGVGLNG